MGVTASIGSAVIGVGGSLLAGSQQKSAADKASNTQMQMYEQTRNDLLPYMTGGSAAFSQLQQLMGLGGGGGGGGGASGGNPNAGFGQQIDQLLSTKPDVKQGHAFNQVVSSGNYNLSDPAQLMAAMKAAGISPGNYAKVQGAAQNYNFSPSQGSPLPSAGGTGNSMLDTLRKYPGYQFAVQEGQNALDRSAASRGLLLSGGQLKDTQNYGQGMADQLFGTYYNQLSGIANTGENAAAGAGNAGANAAAGVAQSQLAGGQAAASGTAGAVNQIGSVLGNASLMAQLGGSGAAAPTAAGMADLGSLAMSDRRLKTDIRAVGKLDSGLRVYSYRFKGSMLPQIGVMADEVERVAPHAVVTMPSGYKAVNYGAVSRLPAIDNVPLRRAA